MKSTLLLCLLIGFRLLTSCNGEQGDADTLPEKSNYEPLPFTSDLFIDDAVADSINAIIERTDAGFFMGGRSIKDAKNPQLSSEIIKEAEHSGGSNVKSTYLKGRFFDDEVSVSLVTEYDKSSLKLLKEWEKPVNREYTEAAWSYAADIKITYTVTVGGVSANGVYYQPSQLNTAFKLVR